MKPGADGGAGELVTWFGMVSESYPDQPKPTHLVTLRHYYTGREITIPLTLPDSTPRIEHRYARIIYNYGSDTVEVHSLPDGTVDVIYNSGLLRCPWVSSWGR
jgi:hypothetical protein